MSLKNKQEGYQLYLNTFSIPGLSNVRRVYLGLNGSGLVGQFGRSRSQDQTSSLVFAGSSFVAGADCEPGQSEVSWPDANHVFI